MNQKYFKRYQFYLKTLPEHTKDCKDRTTNGFRHDNCFCECHDKGKYDNSNEPKDQLGYSDITKNKAVLGSM